jgi:thioredoxin-dependent peroxiredoxin
MTNQLTMLFVVAVVLAGGLAAAKAQTNANAMPKVGDTAPLVQGSDQRGHTWKLADSIGKQIVLLYFYPKDDTSGCTKEACGFRDRMPELQKDNVKVVGVSIDTASSHQRFAEKYQLNFTLVADPERKVVDAYGARSLVGFAKRVSFLIGLDGKIVHVTESMTPDKHFTEMQAAIAALVKK